MQGLEMFRAPARVTFGRCPKSDQKDSLNLRFKNPRTLYIYLDLMSVTSRSQDMFDFVSCDELTFVLRRCRSCVATVDTEALFGVGISGSGVGAETILL